MAICIIQVTFDSVQGMLVQHLKSMLLGGIPQSHKFSVIVGREIETREKMRIFQAFKIQKGVSSCDYTCGW